MEECPFCNLNHPVLFNGEECSVSKARKVKTELESGKNEQVIQGVLRIKKKLEEKSKNISAENMNNVINKILTMINLL